MAEESDNPLREFEGRLLVAIPAFNEEASLRSLLQSVAANLPGVPALVVDDGSVDGTGSIARRNGATVLEMPHNVGVGCSMQAAYRYAVENGFSAVLRLDGDGQHPPAEALKLLRRRLETGADLVVGVRDGRASSMLRSFGSKCLAGLMSLTCRTRISDPTSGFWLVSSPLLDCFAFDFPTDYPEPEGIALLRRQGYSYAEVEVSFRHRNHGRSTLGGLRPAYFIFKVCLALAVGRVRRADTRLSRRHVLHAVAMRRSAREGGC